MGAMTAADRSIGEQDAASGIVSIIIPARNEAAVLGETLGSLLDQDHSGSMRIVVAANGCHDATADLARSHCGAFADAGHTLEVVELPEGGKCAALNAAEAELPLSARLYLDADVRLGTTAVRLLVEALNDGRTHLCAPSIRVAPARSLWSRSYFRAWLATPAVQENVIGAGLLAVSAAGRARWADFPQIVADDYFIRSHFDESERRVLHEAVFWIRPPEGLREVVSTRSRWIRGEVESGLPRPEGRERAWRSLLRDRRTLRDVPVYFLTVGCAAALARWRHGQGPTAWERSSRSRETAG